MELVRKLLKKLKIVLQSKVFYFVILILCIINVTIRVFVIKHQSLYQSSEHEFILEVVNIKNSSSGQIITFKGREKLITHYKEKFPYKIGDKLKIEGLLSLPSKNTIPNLFNYRKYLYNDGIFYILTIKNMVLLEENKDLLNNLKDKMIKRIDKYKSAAYLQAFILGDTSYIDKNARNNYQNIGISHLLAIGGMHISLMLVLLKCLLKKVNKYLSFFIITFFIFAYLTLVSFQVSMLRSALSYILISINKNFHLEISYDYIMILVLVIVLFINPFNIYNLGFQYSYLISFVLVKCRSIITGNYLKKMLLVSFISILSSFPITIYNNYQINILSIVYNLFYVPFINFLLFPLILLSFILPIFDNILFKIITFLEYITKALSNIHSYLIFKKPGIVFILIFYVILYFIILDIKKKKLRKVWLLGLLLIIQYNYNNLFNNSFVTMMDVSQGDSIVVHVNNNTTLIDTGGNISYSYSDNIINYLKSQGIRKIDNLILSHGDYDHMGDAINIIENFKVDKVIFNCGESNNLEKKLIKVLDKKNIKYYSCIKELNIDNSKLYFLQTKEYDNENDNSNVIYTELNGYKFMFMGDAGVDKEKDILDKYNLRDIDVLKVGHHGSKTSSSKSFINEINPKNSIISVGKNNRYGHPNKEALNNLEDSKVYRTDQDGSIIFKIKNNKLKIKTCSP